MVAGHAAFLIPPLKGEGHRRPPAAVLSVEERRREATAMRSEPGGVFAAGSAPVKENPTRPAFASLSIADASRRRSFATRTAAEGRLCHPPLSGEGLRVDARRGIPNRSTKFWIVRF